MALPPLGSEAEKAFQEMRRRNPNYIQDLLEQAKAEFDAKWGINPDSPTNDSGHPGVSI